MEMNDVGELVNSLPTEANDSRARLNSVLALVLFMLTAAAIALFLGVASWEVLALVADQVYAL